MRNKTRKTKETAASPVMIDKETLTRLAYELYVRRGGEHGHALEDWLMAERLLVARQNRSMPESLASGASRRLEDKFRLA